MNEEPLNANGIAGKPLYPTIDADTNVLKSFNAANEADVPLPKPTIQDSIDTLHKPAELQNLRTYQSDVAEAVRKQGATVVKIAVAEKQKEAVQPTYTDPKRNAFLLILSIILMIGSGMAVTVYTIIHVFLKAEVVVPYTEELLFSTESTQSIVLQSNDQIPDALQREGIQAGAALNTLVRLKFLTASTTIPSTDTVEPSIPINGPRFAALVSARLPDSLIRTIQPLYSSGMYHEADGDKAYIVFKVNSYQTAFASMIQWEASMFDDLNPYLSLFNSTTTTFGGESFQDIDIRNKDVRILKDMNGTPLLMYSFSDQNTLVLTTDEDALKEIFSRLSTYQLVR
ncbi:MAG: hypothetical protein V4519_00425 [Patescibacteria group bacterium]